MKRRMFFLYSPSIVLLAWAFCLTVGLAGGVTAIIGLIATAVAVIMHTAEEIRRLRR